MLSLAMPGERKEGADTERTPKRTGCCKKDSGRELILIKQPHSEDLIKDQGTT